jgi:hypothetical protein
MRYGLLGRPEVIAADGRVLAFSGDKERIVLAEPPLRGGRTGWLR